MNKTHEELKQEYLKYREIARTVYGQYDHQLGEIKIPEHAPVQVVDDGAYVEAVVFIPKGWLLTGDEGKK